MRVSLIITTYNRPKALFLVLQSIKGQTKLPDEIIIADDGSDDSTKKCIAEFQKSSTLKIIHSWQSDKGFRVAKSRNKAIAKASSKYVVIVDGDMILHHNFIADHEKNAEDGFFIQGTRVLLTQDRVNKVFKNHTINFSFLSEGLKNRKNAIHSNFLSKLFSIKKNSLYGLKTCNVAFFKKDCVSVNGFNNDFEGWGREDNEFFVRLINKGINRKTLRFNAIQYHLWHIDASRKSVLQNEEILRKAIIENLNWCENGINNFL
jgi:glycosyltransferase involved in cell wall biosynthesis